MTEQERNEMREGKKNFVRNLVRPALMGADSEITDVRYACIEDGAWCNEFVTIFRGDLVCNINVSGDSKVAILKDIVRQGGLDE